MGVLVFRSLEDALREGFHPYDKRPDGSYLVRKMISQRWQLAIVDAALDLAVPDREC